MVHSVILEDTRNKPDKNKHIRDQLESLGYKVERTKKCIRCGEVKGESEFSKDKQKKDGLTSYCKQCLSVTHQNYYQNHKDKSKEMTSRSIQNRNELVVALKSNCVKCGENRHYVLDFHHIDPSTKKFNLGLNSIKDKTKIIEEASKCVCLCRNCHQEFHYLYGVKPKNPVEALSDYLGGEVFENDNLRYSSETR